MTTKAQISIGNVIVSIEHPKEDFTLNEMLRDVIKPLLLAVQYSPPSIEKAIPEVGIWE